MLCVPAARLAVLQVAVFELDVPLANAAAAQPLIAVPPSVKPTVPLGALPVTVAVKVTLAPTLDGLAELDSAVVLVALFMVCASTLLVEPLLLTSPLYAAVMLWLPVARLLVAQVAVRLLPEPVSATALQLLIALTPSAKLTVPPGALPVTVAVKVTLIPAVDGLSELASVVVVATPVEVSVTASMKVVLSVGSVPVKVRACAPLVATENGMLNALKLVFVGPTRLPIWVPSTFTVIGCT